MVSRGVKALLLSSGSSLGLRCYRILGWEEYERMLTSYLMSVWTIWSDSTLTTWERRIQNRRLERESRLQSEPDMRDIYLALAGDETGA